MVSQVKASGNVQNTTYKVVSDEKIVHKIHALLPQTQCQRCHYDNCLAYAHAIACNEAPINQCPPGGQEGVRRLATLLGTEAVPLNERVHGKEKPLSVMYIDPQWCVGCTLCIAVCPVDAILGSNKRMHTVIEDYCTGCELCIPACPIDCIYSQTISANLTGWAAWSENDAKQAHLRYQARQARLTHP